MLVYSLSFVAAAAAYQPFRASWSTDVEWTISADPSVPPTYGPDGPWHAVIASFGNFSNNIIPTPFYPTSGGESQVRSSAHGGNYNTSGSSTVTITNTTTANTGDPFAVTLLNSTSTGVQVYDDLYFQGPAANGFAKATLDVVDVWSIPLPNGSTYENEIGELGLGDSSELFPTGTGNTPPPSILEGLKQQNDISSKSFGLHLGSPVTNISGSLILGGYDQARALGPVGKFWYQGGNAIAILLNVNVGVATGGSPFLAGQGQNLYQGNGGSPEADSVLGGFGAPRDSAMVTPDAAYPYISLPPGNCEAIAAILPVTYDKSIGYYLWNVKDPNYVSIVSSPAYLEFILADTTATNYSIKVPFSLLNLTLESPIIDAPTQYFPCQSVSAPYGVWALGRAFLQAAFLGVSYEQNISWIAQAPGPSPDQSIFNEIQPSDTTIKSNSIDSFVTSWSNHWQVIASDSNASGQQGVSISSSSQLSAGAIAGIVIGAVVVIVLLAVAGWYWFWKRKGRSGRSFGSHSQTEAQLNEAALTNPMLENRVPSEISGDTESRPELAGLQRAEMGQDQRQEVGRGLPHEVEAHVQRFELGTDS